MKIKFRICSLAGMILLGAAPALWAGTATIDATTTDQYIRGFGACSAWHESAYSSQLATWYWDDTGMTGNNPNGIGLSMLRCHIPYTNSTSGSNGNGISDPGETAVMKQAIGLGVTQVWVTEWTPPAAYKASGATYGQSNNTFSGASSGGPNSADTGYANYLVNYIQYVNAQLASTGVKLLAASPQNEPDWNPTYESAIWSAGQFDVFAGAFYTALQNAGLSTKIMIPESFADNKALATTAMDDAAVAPEIGIIGNHLYGLNGATPYSLAGAGFTHLTDQENWETEMSDVSGDGNDTSMTSGLQVAGWMQQCVVDASMNAYHAWWLYPASGSTNESLIGSDNQSTKKLWVMGNWSRFVRPGYYRMGATVSPSSGVSLSAFKSDSSSAPASFVIVAINSGSGASSTTFNLNGISATSVTPWVTDANNNLTRQTAVAVTGNSFTYNLGAKSVVSFVGAATGAGGPTATPTATSIPLSPTATITPVVSSIWRVNAGGPSYTDTKGNVWAADENYTGGTTVASGGTITGTSDSTLYDTQRYGGSFSYSFHVPAGSYQVSLKLAETYSGDDSKGARVFNVSLNGTTVVSNLDIYSQVGANTADDQVINNVSPVGGTITIQFTSGTGTDANAVVEAIQIVPMASVVTATATTVPATNTPTQTATATPSATNTLTAVLPTSTMTPVVASTWRVNAGGPGYNDAEGNTWAADEDFSGGSTIAQGAAVTGTSDSTLYDTQRYGSSFSYSFHVPSASYQVSLKLAETYSGDFSTGARVFNVAVNGTTALPNLDIYSQVGSNREDDQVINNVSPVGGTITIQFTGGTSTDTNAVVEAVQIIPMTSVATATSTPPNTPTLTQTPVPPTLSPTGTATATMTRTALPIPPTVVPTGTGTFTPTPISVTETQTPLPLTLSPTETVTLTAVPPTLSPTGTQTRTPMPPTATFTGTPAPPTATYTATPVPPTPTFTLTPLPTATPTEVAGTGSFAVQLLSGVTGDSTNSPHPEIQIVNTGSTPLALNTVTVRYWFNEDGTGQSVQTWVDWAGLIPQGTTETGNVQTSVVATTLGGQTDYVLYSFTGNMALQPGQSLQIQSRFNKSDWSNMSQGNDWSFAPNNGFANAAHVTGYENGGLVWGSEPSGSAAPTLEAAAIPNVSTSNEPIQFQVTLSSPGEINLYLYSLSGELVYHLQTEGQAGPNTLKWLLRNQASQAVASGLYLYTIQYSGSQGAASQSGQVVVMH